METRFYAWAPGVAVKIKTLNLSLFSPRCQTADLGYEARDRYVCLSSAVMFYTAFYFDPALFTTVNMQGHHVTLPDKVTLLMISHLLPCASGLS